MIEKKFAKIDGINTSYIDIGSGDVVVILHGWGANIESIIPIVNILKDNHRVIAYEYPGHGQSEEPNYVYGTEDYADFLKKFLDFFKIDKASFVGHSFGGKTLTIFSVKHKDMVEKLVLIDASGILPKRSFKYYLKVYTFKILKKVYLTLNFSKNKEQRLKDFYKKFGSDDYKNSDGIMRKVFVKVVNESTENYLDKIDAQTLLIWGDMDDATPLYMGEIFEKKIKDSGLVILKNSGHFSYVDDYSTFRAVMKSYFN